MVYGLWFMVYGFEKPAHKLNKNDILTKWPAIVFKTRKLGWVGLGTFSLQVVPTLYTTFYILIFSLDICSVFYQKVEQGSNKLGI